jgi:rhomboid protease GluP
MQSQSPRPSTPPFPPAAPEEVSVSLRLPQRRPLVTYTLLVITIIIFAAQMISQSALGEDLPLVFGAKINNLIRNGEYWRFLSPALLHASLMHIAFNMYALFSIGPGMERFYGHWRFLALYGLSALGGNILSFLLSPGISVGASTAIFGLVGAEGVFIFHNRRLFGSRSRAMLTNIGVIVAINLVLGLSPGIDNWGHMGGLFTGLVFAWFAGPILEVQPSIGEYILVDSRDDQRALLVGAGLLVVWALLAVSSLM